MEFETLPLLQSAQSYSLIGLMYGHQFNPTLDTQNIDSGNPDTLKHQDLASHIEDFCDCV